MSDEVKCRECGVDCTKGRVRSINAFCDEWPNKTTELLAEDVCVSCAVAGLEEMVQP